MMRQFDAGKTENLRDALYVARGDSANEHIEVVADRWLASLVELEGRAQATIRQIAYLIELTYSR
jgi:hypothetical protein